MKKWRSGIYLEYIVGDKAKMRISKWVFQGKEHAKFLEKQTFLTSPNAHVCLSGGKKCSFFGKLCVLLFLETLVLRFTFLSLFRGNTVSEIETIASFLSYHIKKDNTHKYFLHISTILMTGNCKIQFIAIILQVVIAFHCLETCNNYDWNLLQITLLFTLSELMPLIVLTMSF